MQSLNEQRSERINAWSGLNTVASFDTGSTQLVGSMADSDIVLRDIRPISATSLLVESLIEQLCKLLEKDPAHQKKIYHEICRKLHRMKLIDKTYGVEEFEFMRSHYQKALLHLVTVAKTTVKGAQDDLAALIHLSKYRNVDYFLRNLREVKMLARLNHPNIVSYKAAWLEPLDRREASDYARSNIEEQFDSVPPVFPKPASWLFQQEWAVLYIQMQLCEQTLGHWLMERNSSRDCVVDIEQRPASPSNIFVNYNMTQVQVGDFGLACCFQHSPENVTLISQKKISPDHKGEIGTRLYAAPEQLKGKCDPKAQLIVEVVTPSLKNRPTAVALLEKLDVLICEMDTSTRRDSLETMKDEEIKQLKEALTQRDKQIEELKIRIQNLESFKKVVNENGYRNY
uniref:non-specific serine/threonine protein kinase n=1 Tax=Timema bartmani TaxID=61472 RepID=A0A7R9EPH1_9NEOP|nr:unnamed protein product [Timema bartmani]